MCLKEKLRPFAITPPLSVLMANMCGCFRFPVTRTLNPQEVAPWSLGKVTATDLRAARPSSTLQRERQSCTGFLQRGGGVLRGQ